MNIEVGKTYSRGGRSPKFECRADRDDELDSMAISTYADAIGWLAERGRVEITTDVGRRVIGLWVKP